MLALSRIRAVRRALAALSATSAETTAIRSDTAAIRSELDVLRAQLGGLESRRVAQLGPDRIRDAEFRVFSQFGEDGIIQFLVQRVPIERDVFVEFGVDDYRESNTRFLLVHDNWRGLVLDAGEAMQEFLRSTGLSWRHEINATSAFIDRDNINTLIGGAGIAGDIGLLSVDLDGNDYWVLEAIEIVSPRILVLEYNSTYGPEAAVTVPYDPRFVRSERHWSWLYWGASLAALTRLARAKGYALVGGNRAGNNAFYVRSDVIGAIPEVSVAEAYAPSRFREARDRSGALNYLTGHEQQLRLLAELPLVEVESGREQTVAECFGLS